MWAYVECSGASPEQAGRRAWSVYSYSSKAWEEQHGAQVLSLDQPSPVPSQPSQAERDRERAIVEEMKSRSHTPSPPPAPAGVHGWTESWSPTEGRKVFTHVSGQSQYIKPDELARAEEKEENLSRRRAFSPSGVELEPASQHQNSPLPGETIVAERVPSVSNVVEFDAKDVGSNKGKEQQQESRPGTSDSSQELLAHDDDAKDGKAHMARRKMTEILTALEKRAHVASLCAVVSCILSCVVREYRVAANVTWADTADCLTAVQQQHQCKFEPALLEVLRGLHGLSGLVCVAVLCKYAAGHMRLEEEFLSDPLHTRSLAEKTSFYGMYVLEMLIFCPWSPPFSNFKIFTEHVDADEEALETKGVWHADDLGCFFGLLRLCACLHSVKHLLWRWSEVGAP